MVHRRIILYLPDELKMYHFILAPLRGREGERKGCGSGGSCEGKFTILEGLAIRHRRSTSFFETAEDNKPENPF